MGIDAVAILPGTALPGSQPLEGDWVLAEGANGAPCAARALEDGVLVNLGASYRAPDGDLYALAAEWAGTAAERLWIYPDAAEPAGGTSEAVRAETNTVGRWVRPSVVKKRSVLEELGLTAEDAAELQRAMRSGKPDRMKAAMARLEQVLAGRDPAEVEQLIEKVLGSL